MSLKEEFYNILLNPGQASKVACSEEAKALLEAIQEAGDFFKLPVAVENDAEREFSERLLPLS